MSWSIFARTVVPAGAILAWLLASGLSWPMQAASKVLSAPIEVGNLKLNLAVVLTAFCGCVTVISYAGLQKSQLQAHEAKTTASANAMLMQDQLMRNMFYQERNFWLSLLSLFLWAFAWRLKALHDQGQIVPPSAQKQLPPKPLAQRALWALVALAALLAADVPLCRLNYQFQLAASVTPQKERLQMSAAMCDNVWESNAGGQCAEFCQNVRKLSQERHASVMFVRKFHILGRWAAQLFDGTRGMEQGEKRMDDLFRKKTCVQVLRSVDKSNNVVNIICILTAGLAIVGSFVAFTQVTTGTAQSDPSQSNLKKD